MRYKSECIDVTGFVEIRIDSGNYLWRIEDSYLWGIEGSEFERRGVRSDFIRVHVISQR